MTEHVGRPGDLELEGYRSRLKELQAEGLGLPDAMERAAKMYPHELAEWQDGGLIEVRNELIRKYGAADVFREAYRQLRAELEIGGISEVIMLCGAPGSGKSTLGRAITSRGVIVFDSAGATKRARKAVINLAAEYGAQAVAIWVLTSLDECQKRQLLRGPDKRVPPSVVAQAWYDLQSGPPSIAEGFSAVQTVSGE